MMWLLIWNSIVAYHDVESGAEIIPEIKIYCGTLAPQQKSLPQIHPDVEFYHDILMWYPLHVMWTLEVANMDVQSVT